MLGDAHHHAAQNVDEQNDQARDRVALHEFGRTVHGAKEVGLLGDLFAALLGGVLVDHAGVQVGINRHLFAGHGIQGESGGYFRDASRTLGDHREVDQDQDAEDHDADQVVAGHHKFSKGLNDLARGIGAGVAFDQDHPGRGHIQGQSQHGG